MTEVRSLLFVCLGNICRSPLAEGVMAHLLDQEGLGEDFELDSAGTGNWHSGDLPDPRSRETALRHGFRLTHRARTVVPPDFERFDLILAMDGDNFHNLQYMARNSQQKRKIRMIRDWDPQGPGDVPDPYYGTSEDFELVWNMLDRSCRRLLQELRNPAS